MEGGGLKVEGGEYLEVDDIMLFGPFRTEGDDTAVIEVKCYGGSGLLYHCLPLPFVRGNVLNNQHRSRLTCSKQRRTGIGCGYDDERCTVNRNNVMCNDSMSASS